MHAGVVKKISEKQFGFIKYKNEEYFFHKDDFLGDWQWLHSAYLSGEQILVTFEKVESSRGLRAGRVSVKDTEK